jgi:hypothetical protein
VLATPPAVMNQAHSNGVSNKQPLEVLEKDWHGGRVVGEGKRKSQKVQGSIRQIV